MKKNKTPDSNELSSRLTHALLDVDAAKKSGDYKIHFTPKHQPTFSMKKYLAFAASFLLLGVLFFIVSSKDNPPHFAHSQKKPSIASLPPKNLPAPITNELTKAIPQPLPPIQPNQIASSTLKKESIAHPLTKNRRLSQSKSCGVIQPFAPAPPSPLLSYNDQYDAKEENAFIQPLDKERMRSSFSIDVDSASYSNVRRMIREHATINPKAIRSEEWINYFAYNYELPQSPNPIAIHLDASPCPWNKKNTLVRIAIQGKTIPRTQRPAANLVFLIDVSGSMQSADKLDLLKSSLSHLVEELNGNDKVSLVVYAGAAGLILPSTPMDAQGQQKLLAALDKLRAGGSTAGGEGILLAYQQAKKHFIKDGINRVILASDGDFNVGISDANTLKKMVAKKAESQIFLSVLGFGRGNLNDAMMEAISNAGNGNYYYIDSLKEGRKVLLENMLKTVFIVAKDVKVQVEFNPQQVAQYRLIGYENRVMSHAAFEEKKTDAGDLGAGMQVTALYELTLGKAQETPLRYQAPIKENPPIPTAHANELLFVKIAYKQPDASKDTASSLISKKLQKSAIKATPDVDFTFSSAVALLAMDLSHSPHCPPHPLPLIEKLAQEGLGTHPKEDKREFLELLHLLKERKGTTNLIRRK